MSLEGKTVLVTGGAHRLGRAICSELAAAGAGLLCHYHSSESEARSLCADLSAAGVRIELMQEDLGRPGAGQALATAALAAAPRVDALVNNAAIFFPTPLETLNESDWDRLQNLNLRGAFFLSRTLGLHMREAGEGSIVSIADAAAESPWPGHLPYSISKAGIVAMTRGLAKALAPEVRVNCVSPGPVLMPEDYPPVARRQAIERTLLKREGSASDVAKAVRFLLEGSDYITGAVLPVDGGRGIA